MVYSLRTRSREISQEYRPVLPIVAQAGLCFWVRITIAHTGVARAKEDRGAACAELRKAGTDAFSIGIGHSLFVVCVGGRDSLFFV
jgi:hypothetical protein